MTKLSDTQLIILSRACAREDRRVLPLPDTLKGGAVQKVIQSLFLKGLVTEVEAGRDDIAWRNDNEGRPITLVATDAAFEAIGVELPGHPKEPAAKGTDTAERDATAENDGDQLQDVVSAATPARRTRENTKQAQLIGMLQTGATVEEIAAATGWQKHTVRGAMAGALKKRLGLTVTSEKVEGRGRVYTIGNG